MKNVADPGQQAGQWPGMTDAHRKVDQASGKAKCFDRCAQQNHRAAHVKQKPMGPRPGKMVGQRSMN